MVVPPVIPNSISVLCPFKTKGTINKSRKKHLIFSRFNLKVNADNQIIDIYQPSNIGG
jgi:hypothetical protein